MIKLVVCDMDGTVIGRDEQVPNDAASFISFLENSGIMFSIATGRSEGYMKPKIQEMGISHPYVATNGATVMDGENVILRKQFRILPFRNVANLARELGMAVMYTFFGVERTEYINDWVIREGEKRNEAYKAEPFSEIEWETLKADKILIMDPQRKGAIDLVEEVLKDTKIDATYVRYGNKAIELNERSANKAQGVYELAKLLKVSVDSILVIGDDDNDIEMLQSGCVSAAVGNASENAKSYAKYVCTAPQFEGVKEAVYHFCDL